MLPVSELDEIGRARLDDAKALLAAARYDGAAYLCGYAVELALKARICRVLNWPEFPSTPGEFHAYRSFQTHDLDVLLRLSGQEARIKRDKFEHWNRLAAWTTESRYNVAGTAGRADAQQMITSAEELMRAPLMVAELTRRFARFESEVAAEKGDFALFALVQREAVPDRWDLIVSAPWVETDQNAALSYLVAEIKSRLGEQDLINLSRIVFVDPEGIAVDNLNRTIHVEHGEVELRDSHFFGLPIKRAFIITSKKLVASSTQ